MSERTLFHTISFSWVMVVPPISMLDRIEFLESWSLDVREASLG